MKNILSILLLSFLLFGCSKEEDDGIQETMDVYSNLDENLYGIWNTTISILNDGIITTTEYYLSFSQNRYGGFWSEGYVDSFGENNELEEVFDYHVEGNMLFLNGFYVNDIDLSEINEYLVNGNSLTTNSIKWSKVQ